MRKKRYIYSHLSLDGTPFQYLARPVPILKGRIIAAVLFLIYYSSTNFFSAMLPYVIIVAMILAPWVVVQSVSFNCRYSAYRNLTFRFEGTYSEAFKVLSAWGIIPVFVVGMYFQFWGVIWLPAILALSFAVLFPWWMRNIKYFIATHTVFGGQTGKFVATGRSFFKIYAVSALILIPFTIITGIVIRFGSTSLENASYLAYILSIPTYVGYVFSYAYVKSNITNAVWNRISIGPVVFNCSLRTSDLVNLYLTNALGIIASAGLLIPWAVMRTIQYRVDHTSVLTCGELNEFTGTRNETVSATGSELTDFFDMDLSL